MRYVDQDGNLLAEVVGDLEGDIRRHLHSSMQLIRPEGFRSRNEKDCSHPGCAYHFTCYARWTITVSFTYLSYYISDINRYESI